MRISIIIVMILTVFSCSNLNFTGLGDRNPASINFFNMERGHHEYLMWDASMKWTKFVIDLETESVYFMNANTYKYHYDYARNEIPSFKDLTSDEFNEITLTNKGRKAVSGGIIILKNKVNFDLVSKDILSFQDSIKYMNMVKTNIKIPTDYSFGYLPAFNQREKAKSLAQNYKDAGYPLLDQISFVKDLEVYSTGLAVGRLKFVKASEIDDAYKAGVLKPDDILLTDGIPAEIPVVAGIITKAPATPNSHVAILAKSYGIPFIFTKYPLYLKNINELMGKDIYLNVLDHKLTLTGITLTDKDRREIRKIKSPEKINFSKKETAKVLSKDVNFMNVNEAKYFGGKASNFYILTKSIKKNSPEPALGFSFNLWDQFLSSSSYKGKNLNELIEERIKNHNYPIKDIPKLYTDLDFLREAISKAKFPKGLGERVIKDLVDRGFDQKTKIRFRSSTNVEDGSTFSGAGLYDSKSGCIADDLDNDKEGPSYCDSSKENERGVFRAIKKVFASFYNNNAFIERRRHKIKESEVGMAILVHPSFPNEIELANGVITGQAKENRIRLKIVSQFGADSITNPDIDNRPEVLNTSVKFDKIGKHDDRNIYLEQRSGKAGLNQYVLNEQREYFKLADLVSLAAQKFQQEHKITDVDLDLEFKLIKTKDNKEKFVIKQIRQIPKFKKKNSNIYIIGEEAELCTIQSGSFEQIWPRIAHNYIYKSKGKAKLKSGYVKSFDEHSLIEYIDFNFMENSQIVVKKIKGGKSLLNLNGYKVEADASVKSIAFNGGDFLPEILPASRMNMGTLGSDLSRINVNFLSDNPKLNNHGKDSSVSYYFCHTNPASEREIIKTVTTKNHSVVANFNYSHEQVGKQEHVIGNWRMITVNGLTSTSLEFQDYFAITYNAGHHNFREGFLLDPLLESNLSKTQLDELKKKNIRFIYFETNTQDSDWFFTIDGQDNLKYYGEGHHHNIPLLLDAP